MSQDCGQTIELINPYKLVDCTREQRKGITASSLKELINIARIRFAFPADANLTIVLEQDGTEVDDEEYFATLERNTNLMILHGNQKWIAAGTGKSIPRFVVLDDTDHSDKHYCANRSRDTKCCRIQIESLISSLHNEPSDLSLLTGTDLEMLSDMDPDSVADIVCDRQFLEQIKEASSRFLAEKRQAQDCMTFLHMFPSNAEMKQT